MACVQTAPQRTAIVTGVARGIGPGIAQRLVKQGMDVLMVDILPQEVAKSARLLNEVGGRVGTLAIDVTASDARNGYTPRPNQHLATALTFS